METKIDAEPEKEPVTEKKTESNSDNTTQVKSKTESKVIEKFTDKSTESTMQRLTPAVIVSVSILLGSGILSATSFAKSKEVAPQVNNFYYQLPPPGPYRSTLEIPQPPFVNTNQFKNQARPNFRAPQMRPPQWARPLPPWVQPPPLAGQQQGSKQKSEQGSNLNQDQKSVTRQTNPTITPPAWVQQRPPQMVPPGWARPTPPWMNAPTQNTNKNAKQNQDQKSASTQDSQAMLPPQWSQQAYPMAPPIWARPMPPWGQVKPGQQPGTRQDLRARTRPMTQPRWAPQPQAMTPPGWARPTPPWVKTPNQNSK